MAPDPDDPDLSLEHVSHPPDAESEGPPPSVFLLHGRGADEQDLLPLAGELPDRLHVVSLRAPDPLPPGYTWYDLDLSAGSVQDSQPGGGFRRSLDLVHRVVEEAADAYGLDSDGIGLLGFSQGAILSLSALVEQPTAYAWVVGLNGYLPASHDDPETVAGASGCPVFVGCGDRDSLIPPERAERAAEILRDAGADVTFRRYEVGHGVTPDGIDDVADWVRSRLE